MHRKHCQCPAASCAPWGVLMQQLPWGCARWAGWGSQSVLRCHNFSRGAAVQLLCSWVTQELAALPEPLHTSQGVVDEEPLASEHRAHSHWGSAAGRLRDLVLLFLQFIPTQSKVVFFNAVEHNYRPDRLWQVGWDIYSCSRQMLKWFCIGKCCLWNVLS